MITAIQQAFSDAQEVLRVFVADERNLERLNEASEQMAECFITGKKILICGNGGSQCDAFHFAEEFTGRYRKNRRALPVMALGEASHITCVGNDYGFEHVFSRGVDAFGHSGDWLIGLSTSGNSKNVMLAVEEARRKNMKVMLLLGKDGGALKGQGDVEWIVPAQTSDRIQEVHMCLLHILIEAIERRMFPEHYKD